MPAHETVDDLLLHSDHELHPPEASLTYRQFELSRADLALIRACGVQLVKRNAIDLGEDLLLLVKRIEPNDARAHLGLAIAIMQRIANMSDGVKYQADGITLLERINGTWKPMTDWEEYGQECIEHLDNAVLLAPKSMTDSLVAFRDKCLEQSLVE